MDQGQVFVSNQGTVSALDNNPHNVERLRFEDFLRNFRDEKNVPVYWEQLKHNQALKNWSLTVQMEDLASYKEQGELSSRLRNNPTELLPVFSEAATRVSQQTKEDRTFENMSIQIILETNENPLPTRSLQSNHISKLVTVSGIVISASKTQSKARKIVAVCRNCFHRKEIAALGGFGGAPIPKQCEGNGATSSANLDNYAPKNEKCPPDPYMILGEECDFIDHQSLKLQEDPETIPTGEMPRQMMLSVEGVLVGRAVPGTRVTVIGVFTVMQRRESGRSREGAAVQHPYMKVVGMQLLKHGRFSSRFSPEEEAEFIRFSKKEDLLDLLVKNVAPSIYGHEDIKKAILCQLFGGSRKALPDSMKLRGDINVLLLGDPGTAKSQMLKYVERLSPIGVYTSGKGSSAAGLTASVVKDRASREFYLEGGAMVLADGGIVCIDEFDKMRTQDRVAIHEAMEQQTISIAKAGITTILNTRTSVLAAANPVFGRYDDLKSAAENIDFQSTILSRFDLIFLVKDKLSTEQDHRIASHVIDLHMRKRRVQTSDLPVEKLKRYIAYCKGKCSPRLTASAAEILKNHYVSVRSMVRQKATANGGVAAIPITIRQLEAIIRISEALAKMSLSPHVQDHHVNEACRLFKVSTQEAATSGSMVSESLSPEAMQAVQHAETLLRRRLPIGSQITEKIVVDDFVKQGISEVAVRKAIAIMAQRGELEFRSQRRKIYRKM